MKRLLALALALVAGCATDPSPDDTGVLSQSIIEDDDCPKTGCGVNAGFVVGSYFGELNLAGLPNAEQVKLVGFENLPAGAVKLVVKTNRLVAVDNLGDTVAEGFGVRYSRLRVQVDGVVYPVTITDVHQRAKYWTKKAPGYVETYTFKYTGLDVATLTPLCVAEPMEDGTYQYDAVVFDGERYDAESKDISVSSGGTWFNIACLSGGAGKTFMMRHALASSDAVNGVTTTEDERQTLVNAWTANYCGDGHAFTKTGTRLVIRDSHDWIATTSKWSWADKSQLKSYEAIWGPDGAVCLNTPRRFGPNSKDNEELQKAIDERCIAKRGFKLPKCLASDLASAKWKDHGHILTANPIPAPLILVP